MSIIRGNIFTHEPQNQTLKAWEPFWNCVGILFHFQNSDVEDCGEDLPEWRLYWVSGITLLRTIGHVLAKVDALTSGEHAAVISKWWKYISENPEEARIFWDFIERERNNLVKTYAFGAKLSHNEKGYYVSFENGEDAFQLFREAVYWWRQELTNIENSITSANSQ
ncbi:hypothetical protein [Methylobacterium sp. ID0610]|uniref:hypothetical protein n=1 Tax=Methylobacterium carpenticola TaxID=3344827 RepID=UPI0036AB436B